VALYQPWPQRSRRADFPGAYESYTAAARASGAALIPVGQAWLEAWAFDSTLALYAADGLHPSPLGTWLAALVIYEALSGRDVAALDLPPVVGGRPLAVPSGTARQIRLAAHGAWTRWGLPLARPRRRRSRRVVRARRAR
jgi:hypothetical protein